MVRLGTNFGMAVILAGALVGATAGPAGAISADLARKCRDMAIRAHPPQPAGTRAYAEAERLYYRACITNGGNMTNAPSQ
jgi:hypothetical protein